MHRFRLLTTAAAVALFTGCGGSGSPFDYIPASGKVTYEDGTPLPSGGYVIKFFALDAPQVAGAQPRLGQANVDGTGIFHEVTSYKAGDGLIPGKHRVSFLYATDENGKSLVPDEYTIPNESPLVVDTANLPLDIRVPRP